MATTAAEARGRIRLEYGAKPSQQNYFQARYAVRHYWTGPIKCANPQRNVWGGPPDGGRSGYSRMRCAVERALMAFRQLLVAIM